MPRSRMRLYECPKCSLRQRALPSIVQHRCTWNRNRITLFDEIAEAPEAEKAMKLSTERKHLTNVLKMVAYQIEGSLVELLRPLYPRTEDEGRTLIQTALRSSASIEPTEGELCVTLAPLSSPHRSRAIASVCEVLNKTETTFPGTKLRLRFAVAEPPT